MISFDRNNTNLTAVWNEINSIKVDTSSLYTMITAGGGVIPEELLNSITLLTSNTDILSSNITLLNNNTLYFNNELYSLKTNSASMVSDTNSLNMDVVSLYNICSSLSDSISTITGGGGGDGKYYLALSDAIVSSLSFVYNMTGDIPSLAFNNINFYGNINKFADYSIPTTINKFTISNVQTMSKLYISNTTSTSSITTLNKISLGAEYFNKNYLERMGNLNISAYEMVSNSFTSMYDLNITANGISSCTFSVCYQNIYADIIQKCLFTNIYGCVNARSLSLNTFQNVHAIDAVALYSNSFSNNDMGEIVARYMVGNTFTYNYYSPNIICGGGVVFNSFAAIMNDCSIIASNNNGNVYQAFSSVSKKVNLLLQGNTLNKNTFYLLSDVVLSGFVLSGNNSFSELNNLYFKKFTDLPSTSIRHGIGTSTFSNTFKNIKLFDVHELEVPATMVAASIIGIETMRLNYDWNWEIITSETLQNIQPSNIYTLDFYKCENYISNSTFTIPSYYSGYDEGNVWISGKPLSELGYTLSISS